MGNMPEWFAKTAEMCASDLWFSEVGTNGDKVELGRRYIQALQALQADPRAFFGSSRALDNAPGFDPGRIDRSLNAHFHRDWIHRLYDPAVPATATLGGRYWPTIPSETVVDVLQVGTRMGILKALGEANLQNMGLAQDAIDDLFHYERGVEVETNGIRPLATSWNCVAAPGSNFFEATALRGPTVVELAIATPRPVALTRFAETFEKIGRGELSLDVPNFDVDIIA
jgi:hypothetical protein